MKARMLTKETILNYGQTDRGFPAFRVGDTIDVSQVIKEGEKERIQQFAGEVIAIRTHGISSTFTVRKMGANSIGVERIFPYYSPNVSKIEFLKRGRVRRAKLSYLSKRLGKAGRVDEKIITKEQRAEIVDANHVSKSDSSK
ncbi:MAG: 50S ribosomal protein L19 [bacterium]